MFKKLQDSQGPALNFQDFPGGFIFQKFKDFTGFSGPVATLTNIVHYQ
jgi:hypothetical protein